MEEEINLESNQITIQTVADQDGVLGKPSQEEHLNFHQWLRIQHVFCFQPGESE